MSHNVFISGTGTDIGKTYYFCSLLKRLVKQKISVRALKPILSGIDKNNIYNSDTGRILESLKLPLTMENFIKVTPWYFVEAVSPHIAAREEGKVIKYDDVLDFCQPDKKCEFQFIEGAGGLMSPITQDQTNLDLIKDLNIPVILISGNYLGAISHLQTAIECLNYYNIPIEKIILNESIFPAIGLTELKEMINQKYNEAIECLERI